MEKVTLDPAIKFGAGRYRQEKNLLEECGKEISRFGKRAFINIAVTGVIANITKSFSQSALGHMMYDGVRTYFTKEAEHALHGEIVAVALFTQLYYNKLSEDKEALRLFMKGMDMPLTLQELGIEPTQKNLDILEAYLIDSPYVEQSEESFKLLHEAMKQMC